MRHHNQNRKFGREKNQRVALLKSLVRALILEGQITTTEAKAKELRPVIEKMITALRPGTVASIRNASAMLYNDSELVTTFMKNVVSKYMDRQGGYTRIIKLSPRLSDGSKMAVIEFV